MQKPIPTTVRLLLSAVSLLSISHKTIAQSLFRIEENGRYGYIGSTGKDVIQPIFRSANDFAEGLASVRINGKYGFIDATGKFVIQPMYDYATAFSEGLAIVFNNGKPFYIDKKGKRAFASEFTRQEPFKNGRAKVETETHQGYVDKKGKFLIDTVYSRIRPFIEGYAVVQQLYLKKGTNRYERAEWAVIDSAGRFLIPFGRYKEIDDLSDGYFKIYTQPESSDSTGNSSKSGFVDKTGRLVFTRESINNCFVSGNVHCGLAKMSLYKYWIPEEADVSWSSDKSYIGFINMNATVVVNDVSYKYGEDFSDNRAFVRGDELFYSIIDTKGQVIASKSFDGMIEPGFKQGLAFVRSSETNKWGAIDTNGKFVIEPQFDGIDETGLVNGNFFFYENKVGGNRKLTGIAKRDGTIILEPTMEAVDENGFVNGLVMCLIKGKLCYVNEQGKVIWRQKENKPTLADLNMDYMNRGYFHATSEPSKTDIGGFGRSKNSAKEINRNHDNKRGLLLFVTEKDSTKYDNEYNGLAVQLKNNSNRDFFFSAQDSRLYMKVQAKTEIGEWKDIEYLPSSWCGNSYHTLTLKPQQYWEFITPKYEGEFKTKLRIELKYMEKEPEDRRGGEEKTLYSNEYDGSVNPGQFWRKEAYHPMGLMDPYNE